MMRDTMELPCITRVGLLLIKTKRRSGLPSPFRSPVVLASSCQPAGTKALTSAPDLGRTGNTTSFTGGLDGAVACACEELQKDTAVMAKKASEHDATKI